MRFLTVAFASVCVFLSPSLGGAAPASPYCDMLLGPRHRFTQLVQHAYFEKSIPVEMILELANSEKPFNPVRNSDDAFYRGFILALQAERLQVQWPLITMELQELYNLFRPPDELQPKEIMRLVGAHAVTAPVFTADKSGRVIFAFQAEDGLIRVYRLHEPDPVWIFPRHNIETPGESQFLQLVWHSPKNLEPSLFVYWLPYGKGQGPPKTLMRSSARLGEHVADQREVPIPRHGFAEGVHSFGPKDEFLLFTMPADDNARLIDINDPARAPLNLGGPPAPGVFATSQTGVPLVLQMTGPGFQIMRKAANDGWKVVWAADCPACVEASLYKSASGEVWAAYSDLYNRLMVQSIHKEKPPIELRMDRPVVDPARVFENKAGDIHVLVELEGSIHSMPVTGGAKTEAVQIPIAQTFFLESSHIFKTGGSQRVYLGLLTTEGLKIFDALEGGHLGEISFQGSDQVGWWDGPDQTYLGLGSNSQSSDVVIYRMLAWR